MNRSPANYAGWHRIGKVARRALCSECAWRIVCSGRFQIDTAIIEIGEVQLGVKQSDRVNRMERM